MTRFYKIGAGLAFAAFLLALVSPFGFARADDDEACRTLAEYQNAFEIVHPNARQSVLEGSAAQAYLEVYNSFGTPTAFSGETLLIVQMPATAALIVVISKSGRCARLVAGSQLHKLIMVKVKAGAI